MEISTGRRGQFDVMVDDKIVATREGNFFTKFILRRGWPPHDDVIQAVKSASTPS